MGEPGRQGAVEFIILNWNRADHIAECLESVFASTYPNFQVILVDNASDDGSLDEVEAWAEGRVKVAKVAAVGEVAGATAGEAVSGEPVLTIAENPSNLGYAGGHNLGISLAMERGADYVFLLNSDVTVEPDCLTHLVAQATSWGAGAAGPVVLDSFKREIVQQAGARVNPARGTVNGLCSGENVNSLGHEPRQVDSLMGCAMLLKAEAIKEVGRIAPEYFLYLEESDWFIRASYRGWKILLVPESKVWHNENAVNRRVKSVHSSYYFARNRLYLVRKNFPSRLPSALAWTPRYAVLNRVVHREWAGLRMSLLGISDFLKGRMGKRDFSSHLSGQPSVVVFTVDYKPRTGGIAEHAYRVALGFHKLGVPVTVLAPRFPGSDAFDRAQPFRTHRVPRIPLLDLLLYASSVFSLAASGRATHIYCATSHPCGVICAMLQAAVSLWFTVTVHAHEAIYSSATFRQCVKKSLKGLQVWVFSRALKVFAVSRFTRDALLDAGVDAGRVVAIYNGVAVDELLQAPVSGRITQDMGLEGKRIILTVARLDVHKGHDVVIQAMPAILSQVPDAVYVIAGDGPMRPHLEKLATGAGLTDNIIFTGELPRIDVLALLRACEVFVLNSRQEGGNAEGFGIVLLEAAVFRKPAVGGRSGGIPDAVEDGVTGILVDPLKPEEVAAAVVRILRDPDLAARLGEAGYLRATSEFTWERLIERILASLNVVSS